MPFHWCSDEVSLFVTWGLRRFVPCSIGANHCRLRHIGWENCGHGLTSRPRENASELFLDELLGLFRYPARSGRALLNGTLPLRYCADRFAHCIPTWRLPVSGQVCRLVAAYPGVSGALDDDGLACRVPLACRLHPVRKRFRLNSCTSRGCIGAISTTGMEEVGFSWVFSFFYA